MKDLIINCRGTNYMFVEGCYFIIETPTRKDKVTIVEIKEDTITYDVEILSSGEVLTYHNVSRERFINTSKILFNKYKVAFTPLLTTYPP